VPASVSAVLPTFNRVDALHANLDSVLALTAVDEVVVVDDDSSDGTWAWLRAHPDPRLRCVRQPANRGSPAARNTGAALARGEWVLFVEDDCRFPPDYAAVLHEEARRHGADIAAAPMVHVEAGDDVEAAVARARARRSGINGLDGVAGFPAGPVHTPLLPAPSLVRRAVAQDVGFDEAYRGNAYREETDFFLRAVKRGHICLLTPCTFFWESRRYGGGQPRSPAAELWTVRNNWRFLRRHGSWLVGNGYISSAWREQLAFTARRIGGLLGPARVRR
jgi:GT2 family glycosyltransferase